MLSVMSQNALDLAKAGWGGFASASGILLVNPTFGGNVEKAMDSLFPLKSLLQTMDVEGQVVEEKWAGFESYGSWLESDEYKVVESFIPVRSAKGHTSTSDTLTPHRLVWSSLYQQTTPFHLVSLRTRSSTTPTGKKTSSRLS